MYKNHIIYIIMETVTGLYKWFVELGKEAQLVIALLLGLNLYFGYTSYTNTQELKELQKTYLADGKDCATKIAESNRSWSVRVDSINTKWQDRYDVYRTKTEDDIRTKSNQWEAKFNQLLEETRANQAKLAEVRQASDNIKTKID